jgi:arylsulfatase A-like enzyme
VTTRAVKASNAVVICADTFRADHLGAYGNGWIKTPHLDRLATEGITFQNAFAEALPTIPARKAYFTGRPLFPHWQRLPFKADPLSRQPGWHPLLEHEVTFPELLNPHGFVTGLVADTYHLFKPGMNLARGFSSWQMVRGQEADPHRSGPRRDLPKLAEPYTGIGGLEQANMLRSSIPRGGGAIQYLLNNASRDKEEEYLVARVMRTAAQWLEDNAPSAHSGATVDAPRFVLWVDCFDPHEPWDPPRADADRYDPDFPGPDPVFALHHRWNELSPAHQRRAKALYAGEVTLVDRWIGYLLKRMRELGLDDTTAVFFTTDHGTILGEHGRLHKSPETLIAPETRLPLIVRLPGVAGGQRPEGLLQSYDLLPTLLDVLGIEQPSFVTGQSALPLLDGATQLRDHVVSAYTDHCSFRTADWNFLSAYEGRRLTGTPRLFDLQSDPGETTDVAHDHPGIVRALADRLQAHMNAPPPANAPHPEEGR